MRDKPFTDCESLSKIYSQEEFESIAFQQYLMSASPENESLRARSNSFAQALVLDCFCEARSGELRKNPTQNFTLWYNDPLDINLMRRMDKPICKFYYRNSTQLGWFSSLAFSQGIVLASFAIRCIFIWLSEKLGFRTRTNQTKFVMFIVFWVIYINYGLMPLFQSFDWRESWLQIMNHFFKGLYPDFNAIWFDQVGRTICFVMLNNMIWPVLEFMIFYGIRLLRRMIDQCSLIPNNVYNTKCKTL